MQEIGEIAKKHALNHKKGADKQMDINELNFGLIYPSAKNN